MRMMCREYLGIAKKLEFKLVLETNTLTFWLPWEKSCFLFSWQMTCLITCPLITCPLGKWKMKSYLLGRKIYLPQMIRWHSFFSPDNQYNLTTKVAQKQARRDFFYLMMYLYIGFIALHNRRRLDYQPLFGKGARAPPPRTRHKRAAEIKPTTVVVPNILAHSSLWVGLEQIYKLNRLNWKSKTL